VTKICAGQTDDLPAQSINRRSPAGWAWRIVGDSRPPLARCGGFLYTTHAIAALNQ
jgi:hypothetical protein